LDLASKIQTRAPGMTPYKGTRPTPTTKTTNPSYTDAPPHPAPAGNTGRADIGVDRQTEGDSQG
jgi:hypothetical protein